MSTAGGAGPNRTQSADPLDIAAALAVIPNNGPPDWDHWNRIGMATWGASGGSEDGLAAFCAWSAKNASHNQQECLKRWNHYRHSPPTNIGAGTLFYLAREAQPGWTKPTDTATAAAEADAELLANPDMSVLRLNRRAPPELPLKVLGPQWHRWVKDAAEAASCPVDYVVAPLLASASALIGNARWSQAGAAWAEPPHLWCGVVGDSGNGKSPGSDPLLRDVLPILETRIAAGFPDKLRGWKAAKEAQAAAEEQWKTAVRKAMKDGQPPPLPPQEVELAPEVPCLRLHDVTHERCAIVLASSAPKGVLVTRDELLGWLKGMNAYNDAGRAYWIEAYGGRPYRLDRMKHPLPIIVPHNVVAAYGGTQPDKLAQLLLEADDGLLARLNWFWPDPFPFNLACKAPNTHWAVDALDKLRVLDLAPGNPRTPVFVPLVSEALPALTDFAREMQKRQAETGGLMRSALGKARGTALRLALVLEYLWWCGTDGMASSPTTISETAFAAAAHFVADYLMPMAERVYGDAATAAEERNATTLARWIWKTRPQEMHARKLQRDVRLPGLKAAEEIHAAARLLVEAGWLVPPKGSGGAGRRRQAYSVNPRILEMAP
jgi:hypothetical protein